MIFALNNSTVLQNKRGRCGSNSVTLWAMWKTKILTMQNWNGCAQLGIEETITLTDIRDNNRYTVTKLKDNKCWMTQGLIISNITISSNDSDVSSSYRIAASSSSGFNSYTAQSVYIYSGTAGIYSWNTAVANSGSSSGDAPYSICAKGWRLPTIGEYNTLVSKYNNNTSGELVRHPGNFLSGIDYCQGGSCYPSSSSSEYWTSTSISSTQAYGVNFYSNSYNEDTGNGEGKGCGFNVRCVSR